MIPLYVKNSIHVFICTTGNYIIKNKNFFKILRIQATEGHANNSCLYGDEDDTWFFLYIFQDKCNMCLQVHNNR